MLFHVMNRGVDKREIFLDDQDRFRFIHDLFEFNDVENVSNAAYFFKSNSIDVARPYISEERRKRKLLVQIHAFCLMPNHYHLLLSPMVEKGIALFTKKLNGGYAKYFNEKYQRSGALFQGRAKKVHVTDEAHFVHLPYYIHFNPLDLQFPTWRKRELHNYKNAIDFLKSYRWSSHLDYLGKKNFPSVTHRDFLMQFFGGPTGYQQRIEGWLQQLNLKNLAGMTLE